MARYRTQVLGFGLTLLISGVIAILTLAPVSSKGVPGSDKMHHFLAFAALAFPLPFVRAGIFWPVVGAVVVYGGIIELIQPAFGRNAELGDFLADSLGAFVGASLGVLSRRIIFRHPRLPKPCDLDTGHSHVPPPAPCKTSLKGTCRLR